VVAFIRGQGPSDKHGNGGAKPIVLVIIPTRATEVIIRRSSPPVSVFLRWGNLMHQIKG